MLFAPEKEIVVVPKWDRLGAYLRKHHARIALAVAFVGVFLRLVLFIDNRSLWIDELYLNGNIIKMGFLDLLTKPLDYQQKAPLGYLVMVKLAVTLFGKGERAVRLFSLLTGIGSLFFFIPVARFFLRPWTVILAVSLLAIGEPFVYYATEAKQYSTELCASVLALYLFVKFHSSLKPFTLLLWGVSGGLLVWFSNSSIFILAGIGLVISSNSLLKREWKALFLQLIPCTIWLSSFAVLYFFFLREYADSAWLKDYFAVGCDAYLPLADSITRNILWVAHTHYMLLEQNLGLLTKFGNRIFDENIRDYSPVQTFFRMPFLPLLLELVGIVALARKNRYYLFLLLGPIGLTLLASAFQAYPFYERLILFLAPLFLLLISYGAQVTVAAFGQTKRKPVATLLFLLLLLPPTWNAIRFTTIPTFLMKRQHNREALLYANERYKEGDAVYVYWTMNHAYQYYKEAYSLRYTALGQDDVRHSTASKQEYYEKVRQQFGDLRGKKRLWVICYPSLRNNIGDYLSPHLRTPKWYYDTRISPAKELEKVVYGLGATPIDSFQRVNIDIKLYTLNK
ncbi:glycosyltransferase family 39 protein [uncultured Hymenobacter sp.]|uniref:glycosyltransferase family 39 protein n=1 Tax=uncultured Hymenobacter sp. TaxID=170016 RepID=UPI0035CC10AF